MGNFQDLRKHLPSLMKLLLLSQALSTTLSTAGNAYDPTSG